MKLISVNEKIFNLVQQDPEVLDVLLELGFHHMADPDMVSTVGKIMTISKAANRHKLSYEEVKQAFNLRGIDLMEESL